MYEFTNFYNQVNGYNQIPQVVQTISLHKNNVKLQFYFSTVSTAGYKLSFIVHLLTPGISQQIRASQIQMETLKTAILENIHEYDRKYMDLKFFSTNKAEFVFNHKKWVEDALVNFDVQKDLSIFDRKIQLKIQPPKMILFDSMRKPFIDFITKKLKEEILKRKLDKKRVLSLLPKSFSDFLGTRVEDLFNYEYDFMYNILYMRLKPEFVITASLIASKIIKDVSQIGKTQLRNPKYFDAAVKGKLASKSFVLEIEKLIKKKST